MTHSWLRILLAAYLAIWSPAMCCCDVKQVMGGIAGVESGACGEARPVVSTPAEVRAQPKRSCCASRETNLPVEPSVKGCGDSSSTNRQDEECRCHQSSDSRIRLDTGSKIIAPAMLKSELPPLPVPMVIAAIELGAAFSALTSGHWPPGGWAFAHSALHSALLSTMAQRTLLSRGCMLLI